MIKKNKLQNRIKEQEAEVQWISISDIMTVLMIIFLFISILYMKRIQSQMQAIQEANQAIKEANKEYTDHKKVIYESLKREFEEDLKKWDAELQEDPIVIRFLSPEIMFHSGKSLLRPQFKTILHDFCPRYFAVLNQFSKAIEEIRIEGHTSFEWHGSKSKTEAYFKNMKLSQGRTRSVLQYCVTIKSLGAELKDWATKNLTANGLSSSKPLCTLSDSVNCRAQNRRVEFRAQIDSESVLSRINEKLNRISQQEENTEGESQPSEQQPPQE